MYILTLETTGPHASVAIIDENGVVRDKQNEGTMNHLETLMPMVQELLNECALKSSDIDCIAASKGPGSFTGIRIGISSARAFAQAMDIPCIGVPTLKAFAYNDIEGEQVICPILDARRHQVYAGAWQWQDDVLVELVPAGAYALDDYMDMLRSTGKQSFTFYGDGVEVYKESLEECDLDINLSEADMRLQQASSDAYLALQMYQEAQTVDYNSLEPEYMRKPEAQRKLEEKKAMAAKSADMRHENAL